MGSLYHGEETWLKIEGIHIESSGETSVRFTWLGLAVTESREGENSGSFAPSPMEREQGTGLIYRVYAWRVITGKIFGVHAWLRKRFKLVGAIGHLRFQTRTKDSIWWLLQISDSSSTSNKISIRLNWLLHLRRSLSNSFIFYFTNPNSAQCVMNLFIYLKTSLINKIFWIFPAVVQNWSN